MIETIATWFSIFGAVTALGTLAWSSVHYVFIRKREQKFEEYKKFFDLMDTLGQESGSIASKMAAAYELRKYPDYREVIIRLFDDVKIDGGSAELLKKEMNLTIESLRK